MTIEIPTDEEHRAWEQRAATAVAALSDEARASILNGPHDYSVYRHAAGEWGIIGYSGVVARGFASEREAEDHLMIHTLGRFDDL